jgi:nitrite reductase (NADH) small subunit
MAFVKLIPQSQLPKMNEVQNFPCDGKMICIANVWGKLTAMDNECLHQGGSLGQGTVKDGKVVCPWHGWRYDPRTGVPEDHPDLKLKMYPIKVENGEVWIDI